MALVKEVHEAREDACLWSGRRGALTNANPESVLADEPLVREGRGHDSFGEECWERIPAALARGHRPGLLLF